MQMATWLAQQPEVKQGILAIHMPRMTVGRVQQEWRQMQAALKPDVARRVAMAVLAHDATWTTPDAQELEAIADAVFAKVPRDDATANTPTATGTRISPTSFEVMKVLLEAWLRRAGPLQIQEIARRSGSSYPTVKLALEQLERRDELQRSRDRRAELRGLPKKSLEEAAVLSETLRQTRWIVDVSGRPGDPARLLRRLERAKLPRVAVGGVTAARHYDREFDLNGTPRLDLTIWTQRHDSYDPSAISNLDPGLKVTSVKAPGAIAVVHRLSRGDSLFEKGPQVPFADPVEVLLDLYELGLTAQARAFTRHLRGDAA